MYGMNLLPPPSATLCIVHPPYLSFRRLRYIISYVTFSCTVNGAYAVVLSLSPVLLLLLLYELEKSNTNRC